MADTVKTEVEQKGEETYTTAESQIEQDENQARYYTLTSIKSGIPGGEVRNSIVEFASQFIGNPYVWGGYQSDRRCRLLRFCTEYLQAVRL